MPRSLPVSRHCRSGARGPRRGVAGVAAFALLLAAAVIAPAAAQPVPPSATDGPGADTAPPWPPIATFSVLGYDPATGEVGGAVQSRVFSVGNGVLTAEAGVGVVATQAVVDVSYGPQAMALLREGLAPDAIVRAVWDADPNPRPGDWPKTGRQFAVMNAAGEHAVYTGPDAPAWSGHARGLHVTAQGNILAGRGVVDSMVAAFERAEGEHLSFRLLAALEAGQAAGGDTRGMQSAALVVVKEDGGVWLNNDVVVRLQVDDDPHPIAELRRLVERAARWNRRMRPLPASVRAARPVPTAAPMDTARARALYVSDRAADHPVPDYDRLIARKARTDSIFAARSAGVMQYRKTSYESRAGGLTIPTYVFAPLQTRGPAAHAAMVWVHGGVHGNWDERYLPFIIDAVERGYVIVAPEYRGSTGYGEAHHRAIDYGGLEVDDVVSAFDFAATIPAVDTARVGLMGWSHGGFITLHALFRDSTPFKAGAAMVPVTNLVFRLSYKGPRYQRLFATEAGIRGLPYERRAEYVKRSPYYHVDKLRTPLLVHVATNDTDVDFVESQPLIDALRARKPQLAETKVYVDPTPGPSSGGHTFNRRVNRETLRREDSPEQRDSWNRTWAFFEEWLRPYAGAADAEPAAPARGSDTGRR